MTISPTKSSKSNITERWIRVFGNEKSIVIIASKFRYCWKVQEIIRNLLGSDFQFPINLLKRHFSHDESLAQARANAVACLVPAGIRQTKHAGDVADFHIPDGIKERHTFAKAQGPLDATVHLA